MGHYADAEEARPPPYDTIVPQGWVCYPAGHPELALLSSTDVSTSEAGWRCTPLSVEDLLELGPKVAAKALWWLIRFGEAA